MVRKLRFHRQKSNRLVWPLNNSLNKWTNWLPRTNLLKSNWDKKNKNLRIKNSITSIHQLYNLIPKKISSNKLRNKKKKKNHLTDKNRSPLKRKKNNSILTLTLQISQITIRQYHHIHFKSHLTRTHPIQFKTRKNLKRKTLLSSVTIKQKIKFLIKKFSVDNKWRIQNLSKHQSTTIPVPWMRKFNNSQFQTTGRPR